MQAALTNLIGLDLKLEVMLCNPQVSQGCRHSGWLFSGVRSETNLVSGLRVIRGQYSVGGFVLRRVV